MIQARPAVSRYTFKCGCVSEASFTDIFNGEERIVEECFRHAVRRVAEEHRHAQWMYRFKVTLALTPVWMLIGIVAVDAVRML